MSRDPSRARRPSRPWATEYPQVLEALAVDPEQGLSTEEARHGGDHGAGVTGAYGTEGSFHSGGEPVTDDEELNLALQVGVLCGQAELGDAPEQEPVGDPMEVALLLGGRKAGMRRPTLLEEMREVREVAFDPEARMMATFHRHSNEQYRVAVKGAPEAVIEACSDEADARSGSGTRTLTSERRHWWEEQNEELAASGLRVLALTGKDVPDPDGLSR